MSMLIEELEGERTPDQWFTRWRHKQRGGRILDCLVLAERPATEGLLREGVVELVCRLQEIAGTQRGAEHAGVAVIFGLREEPVAALALAAVRGLVLSAAQELRDRLKLNLVVHRDGQDDLQPTLDYLADPLSGYVHAATLIVGDVNRWA